MFDLRGRKDKAMKIQNVFKRYEIKYVLSEKDAIALEALCKKYMSDDGFGQSTICNIYFDTDDYLLIRRSLEKPIYKEKLRLRSYGVPTSDSIVFPELKKKYRSIVYKRRLSMTEKEASLCFEGLAPFPDTQIGREIAFCFSRYKTLSPRMFVSYERKALFSKEDESFRMTFDRNILWRDYDLSLTKGVYGSPALPQGKVLLEVKTATALPLWLTTFLSQNKIYKTSFSKYGKAYEEMLEKNNSKEGLYCA